MHVGKYGRYRTAILHLEAGRFGTPSSRIDVPEQKLVHSVIGSVCFQQNLADFRIGPG
jgi:hypothetical protein